MATVIKAYQGESTDSLIKRFKKRAAVDNVVTLVRKKEFNKKPALWRKEQKKELERRKKREDYLRRKTAKGR